MIRTAEASGELTPDKTVLEPTSGNTGISLAMVCRAKGYRLVCVLPDNVTAERESLLRAFGAEVVYAENATSTNDAVFKAQRMLAEDPGAYFMPYQYGNENNPRAHYETTGPEILRDLPEIDIFVAGLGTGGTLTGCGHFLKDNRPGVKIIAAVPHPGDLVRGCALSRKGSSRRCSTSLCWTAASSSIRWRRFAMAKEVMEKEAVFTGISAGAVLTVAVRAAERLERGNVVALLADGGWKYLSTGLWSRDYGESPEETQGKIWW